MANKNLNIIELAMKHKQIAIIITTIFVLFGVFALMVMPRNEFPEFTIRQGLIIGVYPGANSQQVEEQLATKVESFLYGFLTTFSRNPGLPNMSQKGATSDQKCI